MEQLQGVAELVFFFDEGQVAAEFTEEDFQLLVEGKSCLDAYAGRLVYAAYVCVGSGLIVKGVVFFTIAFDAAGRVEPGFNLPLLYLVRNAGRGPDLGNGPIRMARRAQCPVPWHATALWQPTGDADAHEAHEVQRCVWRNRLGLKFAQSPPAPHRPNAQKDDLAPPAAEAWMGPRVSERDADVNRVPRGEELAADSPGAVSGAGGFPDQQTESTPTSRPYTPTAPLTLAPSTATSALVGTSLTRASELPDEANGALNELRLRHRDELANQQKMYLDQVRECRDEIQRLKVALRNEQARAQRLQDMLRGS